MGTCDYLGDDPATAPLLGEMRDADDKPRVVDQVWISSIGWLCEAHIASRVRSLETRRVERGATTISVARRLSR